MDRDQLLMGLAAVFAGITTMLVVVGIAEQPLLLVVAPPFAATAYFMWYQASGRLATRMRGRRASPDDGRFEGFGAGARRANARATAGSGSGDRARVGAAFDDGPTREEAYRTLGLESDASDDEIRRAYRAKVKEVHPDTDSGDEAAFKRVNRAYERLSD